MRRVLLRTGIVLAREGGALRRRCARPFRLGVGGPLGYGRQWMPWIHVADEVGAIRFLIETAGAAGPFNLVAPEPVTNADFSRALARALGRPSLLRAPGVRAASGAGRDGRDAARRPARCGRADCSTPATASASRRSRGALADLLA